MKIEHHRHDTTIIMPLSCHCQPSTAILMLLSSTCPPHVAVLTLPPKLYCCIWNGEQQKYKKLTLFQISWSQHDDKKDNFHWCHQSCSVCILLIIAVEYQPGSHTKKTPTLPFSMYGKGAYGSNQQHLYWTVKEESSEMTRVQNWKKQLNKNWAPPSWHHCYDATILSLLTWYSHPHASVLNLPSSCCRPHTATKTLLLHLKWWATKI